MIHRVPGLPAAALVAVAILVVVLQVEHVPAPSAVPDGAVLRGQFPELPDPADELPGVEHIPGANFRPRYPDAGTPREDGGYSMRKDAR